METLKAIFGDSPIDYDTFIKLIGEKGIKLADLSKGEYVSKNKYEDDLTASKTQIKDLTEQISQRNTDLSELQEKLKNASADENKVKDLTEQIEKLQKDYSTAEQKYNKQLAKQQYEFAVKEFASEQHFTSNAAKRDFIRSLTEKNLTMEDGKIVGASDYLEAYKQNNSDAITVENPEPEDKPKPKFVDKTSNTKKADEVNPFLESMHFTGVRPEPKE